MKVFQLNKLTIQKAPGLRKGLDGMDLAKNINIISGPNGSGKSSTAKVIQKLIWPERTNGMQVEGSIIVGKEPWEMKIDSGLFQLQRNGLEDVLKGVPALETSSRYLLALHELISEDETELAAKIAKESIGGISLEESHQNLGYYGTVASKRKSEYVGWQEKNEILKAVKNDQEKLKREEGLLQQLMEQKKEAKLAERLQHLFCARREYLLAKEKAEAFQQRKKSFPEVMQQITGGELEKLEEFEEQISSLTEEIELLNSQAKKCEAQLEQLQLTTDGMVERQEAEIHNRVERLREMSRSMENLEQNMAGFRKKERLALSCIDKNLDETSWQGLQLDEMGGLEQFLQEAHSVLGRKAYLMEEIELLESDIASHQETCPSENITHGIRALSEWLKEQSDTHGVTKSNLMVLAAIGGLTALATFFWGITGLTGILFIAVFVIYALKFPKAAVASNREQDFLGLQLAPPSSWEPYEVAQRLEELVLLLRSTKQKESLQEDLKNSLRKLDQVDGRLTALEERRKSLWERLGAAPDYFGNREQDFSSLYWFIKNSRDWLEAHSQAEALMAQYHIFELQFNRELKELNLLFEGLSFDSAKDAAQAGAIFQEIKRQESERREETMKLHQVKENLSARNEELKKINIKIRTVYEHLGVPPGAKEKVRELCDQVEVYKQVCHDTYATKESVADKHRQLANNSLFSEYYVQIERMDLEQVREKITTFQEEAGKLEELNKDITRIETLIKSKKCGDELEDALSASANALKGLSGLYQENLSAITGDLLVEQLKEDTQNQNRPKVFKRANELLSKITNGRYELLLDERGMASFGAWDTVLRLGHGLSELSTGTRVQLLLAVRLAFIESVESEVRLPILADELLANSDDERATAIIQALMEISKEGRQVFYFTAQEDEVVKWHGLLEGETDLEYKILSLGEEKKWKAPSGAPLLKPVSLTDSIPDPGSRSYDDYGKLLKVNPFDPLSQECSELPLWYLLEDTMFLYSCMKRGIKKWGQLDSFYRHNGRLEGLSEDSWQLASIKMKLLEHYVELVRRGRGKKINREVLEMSNAVSTNFIEEVHQLLGSLEGNPQKLLWALRNGNVPKFRNNKVDDLERFLTDKGYISSLEPLTSEEIQIRLNILSSQHLMDLEEVQSFFDKIFSAYRQWEHA